VLRFTGCLQIFHIINHSAFSLSIASDHRSGQASGYPAQPCGIGLDAIDGLGHATLAVKENGDGQDLRLLSRA
jgi:hypothetical protein